MDANRNFNNYLNENNTKIAKYLNDDKWREDFNSKNLNQENFVSMLMEAQDHPFFEDNRQIQAILKNPPTNEMLIDIDKRIELAGRIE